MFSKKYFTVIKIVDLQVIKQLVERFQRSGGMEYQRIEKYIRTGRSQEHIYLLRTSFVAIAR